MKKIGWITGSNFFNVDEPLMTSLRKQFDITWIVLVKETDPNKEDIRAKFVATGVEGRVVEYPRLSSLSTIKVYNGIFSDFKRKKVDAIYVDFLGMPYFFPLLWLRGIRGSKVIYACHDYVDHVNIEKRKIIVRYKKFIFGYAKKFKFFSQTQQKLFLADHPSKQTFCTPLVMQSYGEPSVTKKADDGRVTFLFYGSIRENKGVDVLIKAANQLYEAYPDRFTVKIYGFTKNWEKYRSLIKHPECFDLKIEYVKNEDVANLFASSDFLVLPYKDVSQSGPMSTAFYYNVPVIAADHDGFKEFIDDKSDGFLFEKNSPDDLCRVMAEIIEGKYHLNLVRANLKAKVEKVFSIDSIINEYVKGLNEMV